jgi:type I restriction enzyme S subunit
LYALLRYTNYSGQFAVRASGANVLHLKPSSLDDISILVPPSKLQESFLSVFQPMVKQKNCLSRQICALTEARDRLLPKLMKGEIAV